MREYPFFDGDKPRIIGHRGAAGVAPENTLLSCQKAFEDGAKFVELDVWRTKDGEVVIIHDATLDRTTNGRGRVSNRTLKELKALDAGYRFTPDGGRSFPFRGQKIEIPTLEDLFSSLPQARAIIEIKQAHPPIVKNVVDTVCRWNKGAQVLLATEEDAIMKDIRTVVSQSCPSMATGFSYGEVAAFIQWLTSARKTAFTPPGQALQIPCEYRGIPLVTDLSVKAAHELGLEMFVWTVNDVGEMKRLLALGVDGIITDYPARLHGLLEPGGS